MFYDAAVTPAVTVSVSHTPTVCLSSICKFGFCYEWQKSGLFQSWESQVVLKSCHLSAWVIQCDVCHCVCSILVWCLPCQVQWSRSPDHPSTGQDTSSDKCQVHLITLPLGKIQTVTYVKYSEAAHFILPLSKMLAVADVQYTEDFHLIPYHWARCKQWHIPCQIIWRLSPEPLPLGKMQAVADFMSNNLNTFTWSPYQWARCGQR